MEYEQFLNEVQERIELKMGDQYRVIRNHVLKNNAAELDGISFIRGGCRISPNIYLMEYYKRHENGEKMEVIADCIIGSYKAAMNSEEYQNYHLSFGFEEMKQKIIFRIVNFGKNRKMLLDMPYVRFLDLAVIFCCLIKNEEEGIGSVRITNSLMQEWKTNVKELMKLSKENTPRLFPAKICTMEEMLQNLFEEEVFNEVLSMSGTQQLCSMYIVSNSNHINGASVILYPDTLREFSKKYNSDFYVLPSSIHEIILIPYSKEIQREDLKKTVFDVNRTQVPAEEILSGEVYRYKRKTNSLEL